MGPVVNGQRSDNLGTGMRRPATGRTDRTGSRGAMGMALAILAAVGVVLALVMLDLALLHLARLRAGAAAMAAAQAFNQACRRGQDPVAAARRLAGANGAVLESAVWDRQHAEVRVRVRVRQRLPALQPRGVMVTGAAVLGRRTC